MFKILRAEEPKEYQNWLKIWNNWENKEVFAHPNYLQLYNHKAIAICALYEEDNQQVIFPFCLRKVNQDFLDYDVFDIITPYGYGDVYFIGDNIDQTLLKKFQYNYLSWALQNNVISEFIRFDLLSKVVRYYHGKLIQGTSNVICDLTGGVDQVWSQFKSKVRRNIKKAIKANLQFEIDLSGEKISEFYQLYNQTMDRLQAKSKYYFPISYFENIQKSLKNQCAYFFVRHKGEAIASVLILYGAKKMYYFLGGANSKYFDLRPNELMHSEIIKWGVENHIEQYVLGGGYANNDSLFAFKKGFSPNGVHSFYCGQYIHNVRVYEKLVKKHKEHIKSHNGYIEHSNFFPGYRAGEKSIVI